MGRCCINVWWQMNHLNNAEYFIVIPILSLALLGFANGLYICAHGIKIFDKRFSKLRDFRHESPSPFDRLARIHRYVFSYVIGKNRPKLEAWLKIWIYVTFSTLISYWAVLLVVILAHYLELDPFLLLSLGLAN